MVRRWAAGVHDPPARPVLGRGVVGDLDAAKAAFLAGRLDEAEAGMRAALVHEPVMAANDLGGLLAHRGRTEAGVRYLLKALERQPAWAMPRYNLAIAFLRLGFSDLGWILMEARRGIPELKVPAPDFPFPEWRGEPLGGRRIIVLGEQGAGDQVMFARYVPELRRRGAEPVFVCLDTLAGLLPDSVAGVARNTPADFWAPMMSLPYRLGPEGGAPPPPDLGIAPRGGGGIGVVAAGSPIHVNDRNRSLRGDDARRLLGLGRDLSPAATGARDFRETAEIIAGLDLVISVDTSVAHLAATLGTPTWILIPALGTDWRWGREGTASPWYPAARLYRQPRSDDWASVLDEIKRDLAALGLS